MKKNYKNNLYIKLFIFLKLEYFGEYETKVNEFTLKKEEVSRVLENYEKYKLKKINQEEIENLLYQYTYLKSYVSGGQSIDLEEEELPEELEKSPLSLVYQIIWSRENITNIFNSLHKKEEKKEKERKNSWQYIILSGNYKKKPPTEKEVKKMFVNMKKTNLLSLKSDKNYTNLILKTMEMEDNTPLFFKVDKKNKSFSYLIEKHQTYTNKKYEVILFIFDYPHEAVEAFSLLDQNNKSLKPNQVWDFLQYHKIKCKKTQTYLYKDQLEVQLNSFFEEGNVEEYFLIPNSPYMVYILEKSKCPFFEKEKEEEEQKEFLMNFINFIKNSINYINWKELEKKLYETKN